MGTVTKSASYSWRRTLDLFSRQLGVFSKTNGWVFLIFFIALAVIFGTNRGDSLTITVIFSLHFMADILIMMMVAEYAAGNFVAGTWYQVLSTCIFCAIKLHAGWVHHNWHYFAADSVYLLAAMKNYSKDVRGKDLPWINTATASLLSLFIIGAVFIPYGLIREVPQWVQMFGIFLFAIALSTTGRERMRYLISMVAMLCMVLGSAWELTRTFIGGNVVGLALSYFLLPLTVLIFYTKLWPVYFSSGKSR
jgi:hypothetical protein